jgi:hypothetical protein
MVYAMIDTTARKGNPSYGFSNAKKAIAFSSKEKREAFLKSRESWDLSAKTITRKLAMKMLVRDQDKDLVLPLDCDSETESCVVMR